MIVLERKLFARRDYEGLDEISKKKLKVKRGEIADRLNRSRNKNNILYETKDELFPKNHEKYLNTRNNSHSNSLDLADIAKKESYEKLKTEGNIRRAENIKSIRRARKLKKASKIGLAAIGMAGLAYGGKKLYDHYKKDSQKEFARRDYAGLDEIGEKKLRQERSKIAKELNNGRKKNNILLEGSDKMFPDKHEKYLKLRNNSHNVELDKAKINKDLISKKLKKESNVRIDRLVNEAIEEHLEREKSKKLKKLKKVGKIGLATLGTAGLVYGGKKLYDHYKNKDNKK